MIGNAYLKLNLLKRRTPFKALYPYKDTRKVKDFKKLSNKKIYFTLQSNSINWLKKLFRFILWPNLLEEHHILNHESFDGYIFSVWYILIRFSFPLNLAPHRMGNTPKILFPRCWEEQEDSKTHFIFFQALQN